MPNDGFSNACNRTVRGHARHTENAVEGVKRNSRQDTQRDQSVRCWGWPSDAGGHDGDGMATNGEARFKGLLNGYANRQEHTALKNRGCVREPGDSIGDAAAITVRPAMLPALDAQNAWAQPRPREHGR